MESKKLYNLFLPILFLLSFPIYWILILPLNFLLAIISLSISIVFVKFSNKHKVFRANITKVWIFGLLTDLVGFLLIIASQKISSVEVLYNPFQNSASVIYTIVVLLICAFINYYLDFKFAFKDIESKENNKKLACIIITLIMLPYSVLIPVNILNNTLGVYSGITLDKFVKNNKETYIGDNTVTRIFSNSSKYFKTDFSYVTMNYQIDSKDYALLVNVSVDQDKVLQNFSDYESWAKYSSLITLACTKNGEKVIIYLSDKNDNPIIKNEYTRENFEKKYGNDNLSSLVDEPSKLQDIINQKI